MRHIHVETQSPRHQRQTYWTVRDASEVDGTSVLLGCLKQQYISKSFSLVSRTVWHLNMVCKRHQHFSMQQADAGSRQTGYGQTESNKQFAQLGSRQAGPRQTGFNKKFAQLGSRQTGSRQNRAQGPDRQGPDRQGADRHSPNMQTGSRQTGSNKKFAQLGSRQTGPRQTGSNKKFAQLGST